MPEGHWIIAQARSRRKFRTYDACRLRAGLLLRSTRRLAIRRSAEVPSGRDRFIFHQCTHGLATAAVGCSVYRLKAWHYLVVSVLARDAGLQLLILHVSARSGGLGAENRVLGPEAYSWSNHSHCLGSE